MDGWIFIIGRRRKRSIPERVLALFVVLSMTGFHLVPLAALAETDPDINVTCDEKKPDEDGDDEKKGDRKEEDEDTTVHDTKPAPETGKKEEAMKDQPEEESEADIVSENEAEIEMNVSAESVTGENEIEGDPETESNEETINEELEGETEESETTDDTSGEEEGSEMCIEQGSDGENATEEGDCVEDAEETPESEGGEETGATIETGDALADGVSVVDVNTNIVGEDIESEVVNLSGESDEDVNLLEEYLDVADGSDEEDTEEEKDPESEADEPEEEESDHDGLSVENTNVATIENMVSADAESGDNAITDVERVAVIETGDATAIAAAVNIVNVNLVGEDGIFTVINNFGEWAGDIVLPGYGLLSLLTDGGNYRIVENDNELVLVETVSASADSGGNMIEDGEGDASIVSGDATAVAASETLANINIVGDGWVSFFLHNFGVWTGSVIDGDEVVDTAHSYPLGDTAREDEAEECPAIGCVDLTSVSNDNVAYIENSVTASASTGGNAITNVDGDTVIETGDATAIASAFTLANVNIVGSDWIFGVFNNFGTWTGNLVFAYPDLAVSIDDGWDGVYPASELTYEVSVANVGRAEAKGVSLSLSLPEGFQDDAIPDIPENLAPGESLSFSIAGTVGEDAAGSTLLATVSASTGTAEKHEGNNEATDETEILVPEPRLTYFSDSSDDDDRDDLDAGFSIRRESDSSGAIRPGEAMVQRIIVKNNGDTPLYEVSVEDTFSDPLGYAFVSYIWDIGGLDTDEGVIIEYFFAATEQSTSGAYGIYAQATGRDHEDDTVKSKKAHAAFTIIHPAYAEEAPEDPTPEIIETAEAMPETLGVLDEAKRKWPLWILLLSGLAYALVVNWSWIPKILPYGKD